MSNTELIIAERSRDIGEFLVGRLLPFRQKRMVGPFVFIDHMGPAQVGPGRYFDVDQHPHIGLSTLTYMLEGEIRHCDSLGTDQVIAPGAVNWMTAGSGVTHNRTDAGGLARWRTFTVHGYQIWVALPAALENMPPGFHHVEAAALPTWHSDGLDFKLVAGSGFGRCSPVPVHSDLFMLDIRAVSDTVLNLAGEVTGELGICIVEGGIEACGNYIGPGHMLVSKVESQCRVTVRAGTQLLLFGGAPFPEERHIYWNFVASQKSTIEDAKQRWRQRQFPAVPHDDSYVPLPG